MRENKVGFFLNTVYIAISILDDDMSRPTLCLLLLFDARLLKYACISFQHI